MEEGAGKPASSPHRKRIMINSYSLERALKKAHSGFWILRLADRPQFPARIYWYDQEICACPKGEIPIETIRTTSEIVARGVTDILRIIQSYAKSYGYNYRKIEKEVRKAY